MENATNYDLGVRDVFVVWLTLSVGVNLYVLPTVIAVARSHPNVAPIAVVNLLLGWTLVGYVAALAWSLIAINKPLTSAPRRPTD